jgi:antitoxin MazE
MRAKISKWGNSLAVRLPKLYAEGLGLKAGATVEMERDGTRLAIETAPRRKIPVYRLADLLAQIKPGQKPPPYEDWSAVEPPWPDDDWSDIAPSDEEMGIVTGRAKSSSPKNADRRRKRT